MVFLISSVVRYEMMLWAHPLRKGLRISRGAGTPWFGNAGGINEIVLLGLMSEDNQREKGTKPIPLARCQTTRTLPGRDNNTNWLIVSFQKPFPFILSPNCSPSQLPIAVFGLRSWILGCSCFQLGAAISAWSTWESEQPWKRTAGQGWVC